VFEKLLIAIAALGCLGFAGFGVLARRPAIAPVGLPAAEASQVGAIAPPVIRQRMKRGSPAAMAWQPVRRDETQDVQGVVAAYDLFM
jgi:hypothetical protein